MSNLAADVGLVMLLSIPLLLIVGVPISVSMGVGAVLAMLAAFNFDRVAITAAQRTFTGINNFSLLAIPFFVLAGVVMNNGGIAQRLINFAKAVIGFIPGALAQANIFANMLFGAISGSGAAAAAAIGSAVGPQQKAEGYDPRFSAAANIASAPAGLLIPPSNIFIIYSLASGGASVAALFTAGYIPGILWGGSCMAVAFFLARKRNYRTERWGGLKELARVAVEAVPALLLIVVIVGGIVAGVFTPTEASCIAVVYALALSLAYRSIRLSQIPGFLLEASKTTGMIIFMIGVSSIMAWIMAYAKIPDLIAQTLLGVSTDPIVVLLLMNAMLLLLGCVMDPTPAVLIFAPIFLPVAQSLGIHVIHFGVIMVFALSIGTITPPVGPILFTGCRVAALKIEDVFVSLLPYFLGLLLVLALVTCLPELSLRLPRFAGLLG